MLQAIQTLFRRRYVLLQFIAITFWLILEIAGYGTGALQALFHRPLTNTGGWRINDLIVGAPPPGPIRLSKSERDAQGQRLAAAFGGNVPKHDALSDLRFLYQPKSSLCDWRAGNVAGDAMKCNDLKGATPLFVAFLRHMHPKTEVLMLRDVSGYKGDQVTVAFFIGVNGKPQIMIDLSRVSSTTWDTDKGFVLKAYGGKGLGEIALGAPVDGRRLYVVADPGALPRREPSCAMAGCYARLLLYGFAPGTNDSLGRPVTRNLADIVLDEPLEQRFKLFTAVRGEAGPAPAATLDTSYKPEKFAVTQFEMVHLRPKLDAAMGAGTTDRALFSSIGYHVAFGTVYAFALDGRLHLIWDGGTPHRSLGTDAFVFGLITQKSAETIAPVGNAKGLHVLAFSSIPAKLTVHKVSVPTGKPWSEFEHFSTIITPLNIALR